MSGGSAVQEGSGSSVLMCREAVAAAYGGLAKRGGQGRKYNSTTGSGWG